MTAAGTSGSAADVQRGAVHAVLVGSGIAGLTVALHAVAAGVRVTLVTKDVLEHANTRYAQGGIAGVMFADDRIGDHIADTLRAGAGLADPEAVRVLVDEGPARIRELIGLGVAFDRDEDGAFLKGLEAAHSYPRILHAGGDATGTAIEKALVARLRASGARVIEHAFLVDLVCEGGRVTGVDLLVEEPSAPTGGVGGGTGNTRRMVLDADAVVLATGGAGQLYAHTTNPVVATGDGIAAALRAGAAVTDLEFFQFHPTVLAAGEAFLVSEAVRGEGATLIDENGRRFAFDAHPDGELAPRDVVARAIAHQMDLQGGRPVHLDATALGAEFLASRFPTIDAAVRERGLDWSRRPIPVTPAAHYLMGGITTDLHGRTSIPGLYAVGEVARTGVHGANRLASNSLLEGAVFGARAGSVLAADATGGDWPAAPVPAAYAEPAAEQSLPVAAGSAERRDERTGGSRDGAGGVPPFSRDALQALMWEDAGLVRDKTGLAHAARILAAWSATPRIPVTEAEFEDENLLQVATALVAAARARRVSVGAHFRSDGVGSDDIVTDLVDAEQRRAAESTVHESSTVGASAC
ncbi:L-aspartate oxidase [Microbacterium sp. DT81.1]|uniref:L-aspartate oxidase n=1 Tax=Microbacterium sp. DT81.1 TaxID=3393413 RepID=UPI003CEB3274